MPPAPPVTTATEPLRSYFFENHAIPPTTRYDAGLAWPGGDRKVWGKTMGLVVNDAPAGRMSDAELESWRAVPPAVISDELNRTGAPWPPPSRRWRRA